MGDIIRKTKGGRFLGWYVRYVDLDGKRKQRASHQPTHALARRYLLEVEGRVARGNLGIPAPPPPVPTVAELVDRFLAEYSRPKIKDLDTYRAYARKALRRALPLLGDRRADALLPQDICRLRDALLRRYSAASVRVNLAYLATVYSFAIQRGIVASSPLKGIERPVAQPSLAYLSRDEVVALLRLGAERAASGSQLLPKLLAAAVHLALHTGLRKGELLGLRWQDLDLDSQRLTVARSYKTTPKSDKTRHLRLPAVCVPVLREWKSVCPPSPAGLVFPVPGQPTPRVMLGLPSLLKAAGCRVPAHPWHALRHTFASHYIMSGGNILALQKILGHSEVKMTMLYAHLAPEYLGAEMERLKFL